MKKIRFSILAIAALLFLGSCTKHKMWFPYDEMPADWAEFQIHYFEPSANAAKYNMDTLYINDEIYGSKDGGTTLQYYNGLPRAGYSVGKFYGVKAGNVNIKCMRGGEVVYDQNCTMTIGKQNVIIHDLNQPPVVVDNGYPYWNATAPATGENWNTDSVCKVMFVNLLYEAPGVPYSGKLQYQYKRRDAAAEDPWNNIGEPVGFGEATIRETVIIHKTVFNSSGYQNIDYRILDEAGNVLQVKSGSKYVDYSDWWTGYIGRAYIHFFRGYRTAAPNCGVTQWISL